MWQCIGVRHGSALPSMAIYRLLAMIMWGYLPSDNKHMLRHHLSSDNKHMLKSYLHCTLKKFVSSLNSSYEGSSQLGMCAQFHQWNSWRIGSGNWDSLLYIKTKTDKEECWHYLPLHEEKSLISLITPVSVCALEIFSIIFELEKIVFSGQLMYGNCGVLCKGVL